MTTLDSCGLPLTGATPQSLSLYELALDQALCYRGDPLTVINRAIEDNPLFVMAHYLQAYMYLAGTEQTGVLLAQRSLDNAAALPHNEREEHHRAALQALAEGRFETAEQCLESLLLEWPRDILALQIAHLFDFYRGDARNLRDRPARVRHAWSQEDKHYHAVLGMLAFGLEECNLYSRAEQTGHQALEMNPYDSWAHHAVAHVHEMLGQQQQGIAWMHSRQPFWAEDNFFAIHNWWHLALFHLDLDQAEDVLQLYDDRIRSTESPVVLDLIDASALLWRLMLRGVDVGQRWSELAQAWKTHAADDNYSFNSFHAMMAFVGAQDWQLAETVISTLVERINRNGSNRDMTREVGLPVSRAFYAFGREHYAETVALLLPLRAFAHHFGGSNAQRDVIDLTLLEAAKRNRQPALVRALTSERLTNKPHVPLSKRYAAWSASNIA